MQSSRIPSVRGRIIPALAIIIVAALLALMAWTLFGPQPVDVAQNGRINAPGVFVPLSNREAPDFTVTDFNTGRKFSLSDFRGKTVVLNFWASWCDPCKDEAPLLERYHAQIDPNQVVIIGVSALDDHAKAQTFVQQYGLTYLNGFDTKGSIAIDYGVAGVPETFVVNPDGELMGKFPGAVSSPSQLTDAVKASVGG